MIDTPALVLDLDAFERNLDAMASFAREPRHRQRLARVWGRDDLEFHNGGDEHGILRARTAGARLPELGETLRLVPGHCDPTVNLHDAIWGLRAGVVERRIAVEARGCVA